MIKIRHSVGWMVRARKKEGCWKELEPGCPTSQWEARAVCGGLWYISVSSLPSSDGSSPSLGCLKMRATSFSRKD